MAEQTYALSQSGVYGLANGAYADALSAIPDSAIHRWPYDEGSGSTVADSIGSADGTINGATWTSGTWVGGYALSFATDDYVDYGSPSDTDPSNLGTHTLAATIDLSSTGGDQWGLGRGSGSVNDVYWIGVDNGNWSYYVDNGSSQVVTGGSATTGKTRIVGVWDGSTQRIYINASDSGSQSVSGSLASTSANVYSGARGGGGGFNLDGVIDNPIIATEAWSSAEVTDDFNRQPWS